MPEIGLVFLAALSTALATGLGALPFLFVRDLSRRWIGLANAAAAGLMLGASHALIAEGSAIHALQTIGGMAAGALMVAAGSQLLHARGDLHVGEIGRAGTAKAILIVVIMTLHSTAEGIGVGVAFSRDEDFAAFVTAAIAVHNIPEGLAISLVLVGQGASVRTAAGWSIFSSLPQPLLAVVAFVFVTSFAPLLPLGLGFAAGAMIWVAIGELLSDSFEDAPHAAVATTLVLALAAMMTFQTLLKG